jgi:hypothetical protein
MYEIEIAERHEREEEKEREGGRRGWIETDIYYERKGGDRGKGA